MLEEHIRILVAGLESLRADLNDEIDAVSTEFGIELPQVAADNFVFGGWTELSYPIVEVASPDWTLRDLSLLNSDAEFSTQAIVRITHSQPALEPGLLYTEIMMYTAAIVRTLVVPGAWNTDTRSVSVDPEAGMEGEYGFDPRTGERQETIAESVITFHLQARADRG